MCCLLCHLLAVVAQADEAPFASARSDILATVAYAVEASFASAQIDILAVAMIRIVFAMGTHGRIITLTLTGASNVSCLKTFEYPQTAHPVCCLHSKIK